MVTCKRQGPVIDCLHKRLYLGFCHWEGRFYQESSSRAVYKSMLGDNFLSEQEPALYIQTIRVPIGFFLAPCKRPSHLRVFTVDTGGSAGTFPLVETFGPEAQRQDGLG